MAGGKQPNRRKNVSIAIVSSVTEIVNRGLTSKVHALAGEGNVKVVERGK